MKSFLSLSERPRCFLFYVPTDTNDDFVIVGLVFLFPTGLVTSLSKEGCNFVSHPQCLAHCLVQSQHTIHTY